MDVISVYSKNVATATMSFGGSSNLNPPYMNETNYLRRTYWTYRSIHNLFSTGGSSMGI